MLRCEAGQLGWKHLDVMQLLLLNKLLAVKKKKQKRKMSN